jgi:alpha-beta hydrolase superfamily lysophospholipase
VAPHLTPSSFVADDGAVLPTRVWQPEGKTKAVVLALHGFNDYSHAFEQPGTQWAARGIATYAYDQRGFGEAPDHGYWAGTARLSLDAVEATDVLRTKYPGVPLFVLGESMGGAVAVTAATSAVGTPPLKADGLILEAPAIWGRSTMNVFERVALWFADGTVPGLTLTGRGLGVRPSDNIEMLRGLGRDPLVIKETRVDTIHGLVDLMDTALAAGPRLHTPLLLLYGAHDELIPDEAMKRFLASLPPDTPHRIAYYPEGFHMLLRDLDGPVVGRDVAAWIANPEAPLPSGADRQGASALASER